MAGEILEGRLPEMPFSEAPMATITTSGLSEPSIAGYSSIQLNASGRANPLS